MQIYDLRQFIDLTPLAGELDKQELRDRGIFIDYKELCYYRDCPWIVAIVGMEGAEFVGFASLNISETRWGRIKLQEFYAWPKYRRTKKIKRFFDSVTGILGDKRAEAIIKEDNDLAIMSALNVGWREETRIENYDGKGNAYIQISFRRGDREK